MVNASLGTGATSADIDFTITADSENVLWLDDDDYIPPVFSRPALDLDTLDIDALWEKMYTKAKAVIITCRYCNSHNAISNPTCVQCGAPLGERSNGR